LVSLARKSVARCVDDALFALLAGAPPARAPRS
jgi:hypothetical protein